MRSSGESPGPVAVRWNASPQIGMCWTERSRHRPAGDPMRYSRESVAPVPARRPDAAARLAGLLAIACLLRPRAVPAQSSHALDLAVEGDERWWVGVISQAHRMPLHRASAPFEANLLGDTAGNQVQPLLVSTRGRFIWSEDPFRLVVRDGTIRVRSDLGPIVSGRDGTTLRDASRHAGTTFFPASGRTPDPILFTRPQFNTWIELTYNQNQKDVLTYAHAIVANGFPPAVLMIDEGWFEGYGTWEFHRGRFPDPKAMMDELHGMGFKVMLWVCPYIQPDGPRFAQLMHDRDRTSGCGARRIRRSPRSSSGGTASARSPT